VCATTICMKRCAQQRVRLKSLDSDSLPVSHRGQCCSHWPKLQTHPRLCTRGCPRRPGGGRRTD
jgi:hypothetical protein